MLSRLQLNSVTAQRQELKEKSSQSITKKRKITRININATDIKYSNNLCRAKIQKLYFTYHVPSPLILLTWLGLILELILSFLREVKSLICFRSAVLSSTLDMKKSYARKNVKGHFHLPSLSQLISSPPLLDI